MAKDESISVDITEILDDNSSQHPITHQYPTHSTIPELSPQWSAKPIPLTPEPTTERWLLAFDIALCLTPLALIAKAVMCIVASKIDEYNAGYTFDEVHAVTIYLVRFNHQLTTIFTVVFVLIITTFVRRLALYMAQEGGEVTELEQLQASISLPGTLKAIWCLRSFGRTSFALLFVWTWFYLGSQATTSEYEYRTSGQAKKWPMAYFSPQMPSLFYANASNGQVSDVILSNINSMSTIFKAVSPDGGSTAAGYDLNGAALLPYLRKDGSPSWDGGFPKPLKKDRHGYFDVSEASKLTFTSSVGTTIFTNTAAGFQINDLEGTYESNSSFLNATCTIPDLRNASAFPPGVDARAQVSINMTAQDAAPRPQPHDPPPTFDVWLRQNNSSPVLHSACHLQRVHVQLKASCLAATCGARKMRFPPHIPPDNRTVFDNTNFTTAFFENLILSNGMPSGENVRDDVNPFLFVESAIERDMVSAFSYSLLYLGYQSPQDLGSVADPGGPLQSLLSSRMTAIINSYYDASVDPWQGSWTDPIANYESVPLPGLGNSAPSDWWYFGTLKGNLYEPQYSLSIPWVIVDLISCQILLLAAVASAWLRRRTLAPDIFGYVSSLTRDNPHLNLPEGGSTMSGLERARALKGLKVRIGDVADANGVGRVGLTHAGPDIEATIEMAHLKRDRQYV